jgi:hypothetical protein
VTGSESLSQGTVVVRGRVPRARGLLGRLRMYLRLVGWVVLQLLIRIGMLSLLVLVSISVLLRGSRIAGRRKARIGRKHGCGWKDGEVETGKDWCEWR